MLRIAGRPSVATGQDLALVEEDVNHHLSCVLDAGSEHLRCLLHSFNTGMECLTYTGLDVH
jgi:hypothetical protein